MKKMLRKGDKKARAAYAVLSLTGVLFSTVGLLRVIITTQTLYFSFMLTSSSSDYMRAPQLPPALIVQV